MPSHAAVSQPPRSLVARRKERTRRELAEAATRLFLERGYDATTVEEIAAAVEISPRTFFRYFPTKGDIVTALARMSLEDLVEVLRERPAAEPLVTSLQAALTVTLADADPVAVRAFEALLRRSPELRARWLEECRRNQDVLAGVLAARLGTAADDLRTRVIAGAVITSIETALDVWSAGPGTATPLEVLVAAMALLAEPLLS